MSLNYKLRRNLASYRVTSLPDSLIEEDLRAAYKIFCGHFSQMIISFGENSKKTMKQSWSRVIKTRELIVKRSLTPRCH